MDIDEEIGITWGDAIDFTETAIASAIGFGVVAYFRNNQKEKCSTQVISAEHHGAHESIKTQLAP